MYKTNKCFCRASSQAQARIVTHSGSQTLNDYTGKSICRVSTVNGNELYACDFGAKKIIKFKDMKKEFEITGFSGPRACSYKEGSLWVADGTNMVRIDGDTIGASITISGGLMYDVSAVNKTDAWFADQKNKMFRKVSNGSAVALVPCSYSPSSISALPDGTFWAIAFSYSGEDPVVWTYYIYYYNGSTLSLKATVDGETLSPDYFSKYIFAISGNQCVFAISGRNVLYKLTNTTLTTEFTFSVGMNGFDGFLGDPNTFLISDGGAIKLIVGGVEQWETATGQGYSPSLIPNQNPTIIYGGL